MEYKLKQPALEKTITDAYHKTETSVVNAYKKVENTAVSAYKKIENAFIDRFLEKNEPEQE